MGGDKTEKITIMLLKVDLQCSSCYKKIKKILCKFPQIRDQTYDEKANIVTITVLCCNPEKIRDKLCCKGGGVIKSIEIKEPQKPKEPEKPKVPEKPKDQPEKPKVVVVEKPKEPEKPKVVVVEKPKEPKVVIMEKPKESEKPKVVVVENPKVPEKPKVVEKPKEPEKPKIVVVEKPKEPEKPKQPVKPKEPEKPKEAPKPAPVALPPQPQPQPHFPPVPEPVIVMPIQGYPHQPSPGMYCCGQCYEGYTGGPCYHDNWYGRPVQPPPPPPCYNTYSYGYGPGPGTGPIPYGLPKGCYVNKCDYFSEENASGCSIM
ncbi:hypothetical protein H5410_029473 [Solanum commersonii]|uniref:Uncharacterized protein n=1 Tax=Solanum commersonii TaxID=4109 RepID=A0A9J5Z6W6_SOLCO|nr:hypothetical protein H5410_029473 [Solanum commersonii]